MMGVYMLRCGDGSYYVGSSRNIEHRLWQHSRGAGGDYTSKRQPVELVFVQEFDRIDEAYVREKQLQGWSRRKREARFRYAPAGAAQPAEPCGFDTRPRGATQPARAWRSSSRGATYREDQWGVYGFRYAPIGRYSTRSALRFRYGANGAYSTR